MIGVLFGRAADALFEDRFDLEAHIAERLGLARAWVDLDEVLSGWGEDAVAHLPRGRGMTWVYRGWLLSEDEYAELDEAVRARGDRLAVTPTELAAAAYLPQWAPDLGVHTPPSVWTDGEDADEAWELAHERLGPPPWIVKDHLKSARPLWHACFVPPGADRDDFARVVAGLLDFRGERFVGGLVVRRCVRLATLPLVTEGRPVPDEHRLFVWQGRIVGHAPYYDVDVPAVDPDRFAWIGDVIPSPFFTIDAARLEDGGWTVIEINDGGCSGIPEQLDPWVLYEAIADDPPA